MCIRDSLPTVSFILENVRVSPERVTVAETSRPVATSTSLALDVELAMFWRVTAEGKGIFKGLYDDSSGQIMAVSYTHLDVYKRQWYYSRGQQQ